ncbi:hypothetical protein I545_6981, partial [Mycobacterium kansasii 662]
MLGSVSGDMVLHLLPKAGGRGAASDAVGRVRSARRTGRFLVGWDGLSGAATALATAKAAVPQRNVLLISGRAT